MDALSQKVTFLGKLDLDTELRFLNTKDGDYVYAENMRMMFSQDRNEGSGENFRGTLKIKNDDLLDDTGRYVTTYECIDKQNNRLFFFVCDTKGTGHGIYAFDASSRTIIKIYVDPQLNFSLEKRVHSAFVVNNMLFFADSLNQPRKLNVKDAMAGLYSDSLPEYMNQIKNQPSIPITCSEPTGIIIGDFTQKKSFQFRYKYVYAESESSAWSMPSLLYSTGYRGVSPGVKITIQNNELDNAVKYSKIIKFIDVSFRDSDIATWRFFKRIPFPTDSNASISELFFNDGAYSQIDAVESAKLYDYIPLVCDTMQYVENRIVEGGAVFGYDIPVISIANVLQTRITPARDKMYLKSGGRFGVGIVLFDTAGRATNVVQPEGLNIIQPNRNGAFLPEKFSFNVGGVVPDGFAYWAVVMTKVRNKAKFINAFINNVTQDSTKISFSVDFIAPTNSGVTWLYTTGDKCSILTKNPKGEGLNRQQSDLSLDYDPVTSLYTAKWYGSGVDTVVNGALIEIYTPTIQGEIEFYWEICKTYPVVIDGAGKHRYGVDFNGNFKSVEIGADGTDGDIHYRLPTAETGKPDSTKAFATFLFLDSPSSAVYTVKVRGVSLTSPSFTSAADAANWFIIQTIYETIITLESPTSIKIESTIEGADAPFITPTFTSNVIMTEFLDSATAELNNSGISIEAMSANDLYYENWQHNIGRAMVISQTTEKQITDQSILIASDTYVQGSNINGLSSFSVFNQKQLPVSFGPITKISVAADYKISGSVMLVTTLYENVAFYINKQQYTNTDGSTQLGITDQFFGSFNLLQGGFGSANPESIVQYGGRVYGWDVIKGVIWRYSQDGVTPISHIYRARNYASKLGKKISANRVNKLQKAIGGYDPYFDEYLLQIKDIKDPDSAKVFSFNESGNGFNGFWGFKPDCMGYINQTLVSWKNGQLYLHYEGETFNEVYGEILKSKVAVVFNDNPGVNKILLSLKIEAQDRWVPVKITQHATTDGKQLATSNLPVESKREEWDFFADTKRSGDRINGENIRGKYFYVELELEQVNYLTCIYAVNAKYSISNPT